MPTRPIAGIAARDPERFAARRAVRRARPVPRRRKE